MSELFNPDDTGVANGNYFGFPFTEDESELVLVSVPWDVTVSYNDGTAAGPQAIAEASTQVEIYDARCVDVWKRGIGSSEVLEWFGDSSGQGRVAARRVIEFLESGGETSCSSGQDSDSTAADVARDLEFVNELCGQMNERVESQCEGFLARGKTVGVVGGDHSVPLGLIRALGVRRPGFGILHIDAHCDLRDAYEGFEFSHASIMFNALKCEGVGRIVQVGVRDFCSAEVAVASASQGRVVQYPGYSLARSVFNGVCWADICREIVAQLPQEVYVSFDIDGLSPDNCPNTGTPVPGGLSFEQAVYLVECVVESGRKIVGFDLTEVAPGEDSEWDANVGARVLYALCGLTLRSNG